MKISRSEKLFQKAQRLLPGGVNSPVRAFKAVGGTPRFISRAEGPYLFDVDDNQYVDYVCSWGPMILGHAPLQVIEAVQKAIEKGTSYGAPTEVEVELANMVVEVVPSIEMVRFVNSGTEATMSSLRLARAYTERDKIIKFAGCYHGHADLLLVQAGSGITTLGLPDSPGVPRPSTADTLVAHFNNLESVKELYAKYPEDIAAVIVEPVAGNMGVVPAQPGFLQGLRELTHANGSLLIFDEIITGFRVAYGGAQQLFGILPDLTCLGKIIGGGLPIGAYGGRMDIMQLMAPTGPVYQAGTLSGNPVAMTAGLETLKALKEPGVYERLEALASQLATGIREANKSAGVPIFQSRVGSMLGLFFTDAKVFDFTSAKTADAEKYGRFFHKMLQRGYYIAPSQFEALFVSTAHDENLIAKTVSAISEALNQL